MTPAYWTGKAVRLAVAEEDPDLVILFGSAAKGGPRPPQDIDLAIVRDTPLPRRLRGLDLKARFHASIPVRIDAVFLTPAELAAGSRCPGSFVHSVLTTGICLYRRNGIDDWPEICSSSSVRSDLGSGID